MSYRTRELNCTELLGGFVSDLINLPPSNQLRPAKIHSETYLIPPTLLWRVLSKTNQHERQHE